MKTILAISAVAVFVIIVIWVARRRSGPRALTGSSLAVLRTRLPHYASLQPVMRALLEQQVAVFLAKKRFYGCNGLAVTDEMRVLVAGLACLLILRPGAKVFPSLRSVLLYPTAFWVRHQEPDDVGLVYDEEVLQLGESQEWGRVVLSWEDVEAALAGEDINVVAHEFAHQLDDEAPAHEGAPALADYSRWSKVMREAFEELCDRGSAVLDDYGTEGPAEFFAVATEAYFQNGAALKRHHRELYGLLRDYYLVETA